MMFSCRLATRSDIPVLENLMRESIHVLLRRHLTDEQVAASFAIMGLDTQLIEDGTYFAVEAGGRIAGCGGWSRRATLFGGDHSAGRSEALLDPATDAARIRAMYTHPEFVRQGVGRLILAVCEDAAAKQGFGRVELAATLSGLALYRACGYREVQHCLEDTPSGIKIPIVRMIKALAAGSRS